MAVRLIRSTLPRLIAGRNYNSEMDGWRRALYTVYSLASSNENSKFRTVWFYVYSIATVKPGSVGLCVIFIGSVKILPQTQTRRHHFRPVQDGNNKNGFGRWCRIIIAYTTFTIWTYCQNNWNYNICKLVTTFKNCVKNTHYFLPLTVDY